MLFVKGGRGGLFDVVLKGGGGCCLKGGGGGVIQKGCFFFLTGGGRVQYNHDKDTETTIRFW